MLLVMTIWFIWEQSGLLIALSLVSIVFVVERTIHTEYIVDTGDLSVVVHKGRFSSDVVLPVAKVSRIELIRRYRFGKYALKEYILLTTTDGKELSLTPSDYSAFVDAVKKARALSDIPETEDEDDDDFDDDLSDFSDDPEKDFINPKKF